MLLLHFNKKQEWYEYNYIIRDGLVTIAAIDKRGYLRMILKALHLKIGKRAFKNTWQLEEQLDEGM